MRDRRRLRINSFVSVLALFVFAYLYQFTPRVGFDAKSARQLAYEQMGELQNALTMFSLDIGRYPTSSEGLDALLTAPGNVGLWKGPYVQGGALPKDPWNHPYAYRGEHGSYELLSFGRDGVTGGHGLDADIKVPRP